jgi:hypothetical protein
MESTMRTDQSESLIHDLQTMQEQLSNLLASVAYDQDWQARPDEWSFRYVAAHLAVCEKECLQERIRLIASGDNPHFEYYWNTGRDFSRLELTTSLQEWAATRLAIFDFVRALPEAIMGLTGTHRTFGQITVLDYLRIALEHDQEHLKDLDTMLVAYQKQKADSQSDQAAA